MVNGFRIAVILSCLTLLGCHSMSSQSISQDSKVLKSPNPILNLLPQNYSHSKNFQATVKLPEEITFLNQAQQDAFRQYFYSPTVIDIPAHRRLYKYIDSLYWGFNYLGKTYDAETALELKAGNCMSLAILTSALARLVDIEVKYQRVDAEPVYHRHNDIMTLSTHVRSHLIETLPEDDKEFIGIRGRIIVDYYPQRGNIRGGMLDHNTFYSMYYRNLAADAMLEGKHDYAYALMHQAIEIAGDDVENVNTMAVVLNKIGYSKHALAVYAFGLELEQNSLNLLSNYANLLEQTGDNELAEKIKSKIDDANDDNPYHLIDLAETYISEGRYKIAKRLINRAIDRAPYLHEAYFALARTYYLSQQSEKADKALQTAAQMAYLPETEKLYEAKRFVLSQEVR